MTPGILVRGALSRICPVSRRRPRAPTHRRGARTRGGGRTRARGALHTPPPTTTASAPRGGGRPHRGRRRQGDPRTSETGCTGSRHTRDASVTVPSRYAAPGAPIASLLLHVHVHCSGTQIRSRSARITLATRAAVKAVCQGHLYWGVRAQLRLSCQHQLVGCRRCDSLGRLIMEWVGCGWRHEQLHLPASTGSRHVAVQRG